MLRGEVCVPGGHSEPNKCFSQQRIPWSAASSAFTQVLLLSKRHGAGLVVSARGECFVKPQSGERGALLRMMN